MSFLLNLVPAQYRLLAEIALFAVIALAIAGWVAVDRVEHYNAGVAAEHVLREADNTRWQLATNKLKAEAAQQLATETAKAQAAESRLHDLFIAQEKTDENHQAVSADLTRRLAAAGRLRDPFAAAPGRGAGSCGAQAPVAAASGAGAGDRAEAGGVLSAELTGLLLDRAREADAINNAFASCKPDAVNLRRELQAH